MRDDEIFIDSVGLNPTPAVEDISEMSQVLRGEISAVEAYNDILEKFADETESERLREFLQDHSQAVAYWEKEVHAEGVVPDHTSGPWGKMVEALVGTAKLLGNTAALRVLKEGEEHGLKEYQEMLDSDHVSLQHKQKIRESFIPNQEKHITSLQAMMRMH